MARRKGRAITAPLVATPRPGRRPRRILAVLPWPRETLILRRFQGAAAGFAGPADDLVRAATVATLAFQAGRPARIADRGPTTLGVPEQDLALAIALHAHVHGRERGSAELRG